MRTTGQRSVGWLDITTRAALILQETHPLEKARIPSARRPASPPGKTITCARALLAAAVPATLQVDVAPQNLKRYDALKNSPRRVVRWLLHRRPAIAVPDEESRCRVARPRLAELLRSPLRGRLRSQVNADDAPAVVRSAVRRFPPETVRPVMAASRVSKSVEQCADNAGSCVIAPEAAAASK